MCFGDASGDEGQSCRMAALNDASKLGYEQQQKVGTTEGGNRGVVSANGGGRSAADSKYAAATATLVADVTAFLAMDVYDPKRTAAVEALKKEGNTWTSQYAPGGSSKRASGRAFYNWRAPSCFMLHVAHCSRRPLTHAPCTLPLLPVA